MIGPIQYAFVPEYYPNLCSVGILRPGGRMQTPVPGVLAQAFGEYTSASFFRFIHSSCRVQRPNHSHVIRMNGGGNA
eukprot:scaffold319597_cov37-Prasinocladus_malaysianus.AAC.2